MRSYLAGTAPHGRAEQVLGPWSACLREWTLGPMQTVGVRVTTPSATRRRRPATVRVTIGLLVFLGLSGLFGGIGLIFGLWGMDAIPREPLDRIPLIDSWLIPGLVLVVGFGLGPLIAAYGVLHRSPWPRFAVAGRHWSWLATLLLGLGQLAWLLVEFLYVGPSLLLAIYGAVGVALSMLPTLMPVRRYLATDGTP
jgi:hypothetical protein